MANDGRFPVVLLWHMHQPEYRVDGRFELPWTCLHALKDYSDMAAHLEAVPGARAVVNLAPVLLEQLDDYAQRFERHARDAAPFDDPMLDALVALPPPGPRRARVARMALRVDSQRQLERLDGYRALLQRWSGAADAELADLSDRELTDLLIGWYLAWLAPSVAAADADAAALLSGQGDYGAVHRQTALRLIGRTIGDVLPRYRALAEQGRVEISTSPYQHALLPLLVDFASAHDVTPHVPLPAQRYPGGPARAAWHVDRGLRTLERLFGQRVAGCWPSEAAISDPTLALLERAGVSWVASSHAVLGATLRAQGWDHANPHLGYRTSGGLACFFRDDGLSDRIGFVYKDWDAQHAVDDLVGHVQRIAATPGNRMLLIALDGENAWAHYPGNGTAFLRGLYARLADHPALRMATLGELAARDLAQFPPLPPLRAGSWVHGQLLTWVGDAEKNRAWELLTQAKLRYDAAVDTGRAGERSEHLLAVCEASDWFWWPGSTNPTPAVADFDALFRAHLRALYRSLGVPSPAVLHRPFARGVDTAVAAGGVMRPSVAVEPWIERSAGVLLSLRSLPKARIEPDARAFVDFAVAAGFHVWQLLPLGPADAHDNPFQPASAFAGDVELVGAEEPVIDEADFAAFCTRERDWLDDWALFCALKQEHDGRAWFEWPAPLRHREPQALHEARTRLRTAVERACRAQYRFTRSWAALKRHANAHGLLLFGDVPLFVAHDSADVWAQRELFEVDADGQVQATVGVPPDAFSETGQSWGYPPYRWEVIAARQFRWWRRRFEVQAARYDLVRLDHFRGLAAWWRVPAGAASAVEGQWIPGPGHAALEALAPVLHGARLVAEDLGLITPDVIALRHDLAIPGMRVLQFAFDGDRANPYLPRHHDADSVCYTGTHDNDTTLGWWRSLGADERARVASELRIETPDMPDDLIDAALGSPAPLTIVPMQDFLRLGSEARMNRPGIAEGNWRWQVPEGALTPALAARLRQWLSEHARIVL